MKGDVDVVAEGVVRLVFSRLVELSMAENVEVNGEVELLLREALLDEPGRRADGSSVLGPTFVDNGVRPRRLPAVVAGSPQADCRGLADPALDEFAAVEVIEFWEAA